MTPSPSGSALGWALSQEKAPSASQSGRTSARSEGLVTRARAATASARRASPSGWASSSRRNRASTIVAGASPRASAGTPPASTASTRASGEPPAQASVCDRSSGSSRPRAASRASASALAERAEVELGDEVLPAAGEPAGAGRPARCDHDPGTETEGGAAAPGAGGSRARRGAPRSRAAAVGGRARRAGSIASSSASASGARSRASTVTVSIPRASACARKLAQQRALADPGGAVEEDDADRCGLLEQTLEPRQAPRCGRRTGPRRARPSGLRGSPAPLRRGYGS